MLPDLLTRVYYFSFFIQNMNRFRFYLLLCFFLSFGFSAFAQSFKVKDVIKWTEKHDIPANAKVGDIVTLNFTGTLKEGFHIYASQQPSKATLPLEFILDKETKGAELSGKVIDGPGKKVEHDDVFDADVAFYEKTATFTQKIKITAENPVIVAHLRYQVCDESMCVPDNYELKIPVKTVAATTATDTKPASTATTATPATTPATVKKDTARTIIAPEASEDTHILNGVHWTVKVTPEGNQKPKVGDIVTLKFHGLIEPGIKIYEVYPQKNGSTLMPAFSLSPESKNIEEEGDVVLSGKRKQIQNKVAKSEMVFYEDSVIYTQKLKVTGDNPVLKGNITFHAGEKDKLMTGKQEIEPAFTWAETAVTPAPTETPKESSTGCNLWELIILGLIAGIGAVLTPCFYPMIPLTVSYFTKKSGSRSKGIFNAIFYGLSIIVMFTGVTLLLAAIFGPDILHKVATNPWVNLILFAIIFAFGLSFLGLFDLSLPSGVVNAISKRGSTSSLSGIFFMAMTLVLVSFSCTGAFVAPLLTKAAVGGSWICIIVPMLAFSTALALPFTILALFPSLLQSMPRSGGWLGTFKVTLGFLEIALAFMYLSNADLVQHWGLLPRPLFLSIWVAISAALGLYLIGKLHIKNDNIPAEGISVPRVLFGVLFLALAVYMFSALPNRPIRLLDSAALLPPPEIGATENNTGSGSSESKGSSNEICDFPNKKFDYLKEETPPGICAFYDLEQGLEYAKKVNKPVLLDFTGHTCKNCRKIEQTVWTDPAVKKMLTEDYVLVSLFTDDNKDLPSVEISPEGKKIYTVGDKWRDYENRIYGFIAQPYYVLLDHDKSKLVPSWDYQAAPDVATYKKNLDAGLAEFKKRKGL